MAAQSLYFLSDGPVQADFDIEPEGDGVLSLEARFNPRRADEGAISVYQSGDELAEAMHEFMIEHFRDHGARLSRIRYRHPPVHVTIGHLGRYGVPLYPDDTGAT